MKFIFAIEVSGICDNGCSYCPYPNSKRKKGIMSFSTFKRTMDLVRKLNQNRICLHNFGEPLLHPDIVKYVEYARKYVDNVVFSTNGVSLTRKMAESLKDAGLTELYLSFHDKKIANRAKRNCKNLDILKKERSTFTHDWAGTSEKKTLYSRYTNFLIKSKIMKRPDVCHFIDKDRVVILWDGRINSCCIDMEGLGVLGSIFDKDPFEYKVKSFSLCKTCHKPYRQDETGFYK